MKADKDRNIDTSRESLLLLDGSLPPQILNSDKLRIRNLILDKKNELAILNDRFYLVLNHTYLLEPDTLPLSFAEIGEIIGVGKDRIRQIHKLALENLHIRIHRES